MDPIDRDDFNPRRGREANEETIANIKQLAEVWHGLEDQAQSWQDTMMVPAVREAIETGHSYRQLAEAAGVSTSVIQRMVRECE